MKFWSVPLLAFVLLHAESTDAQEAAAWDPLPATVWEVRPDSAAGDVSAIMLFERVAADEKKLDDEKCFVSVYRRVLIFNHEGREWADVHVQFDPEDESVDRISGRTVLRDGRTVALDPATVLEKEVIRTEGAAWREKFFTLPGVEDSCIVEYKYRRRSPSPNTTWIAQQVIPVKEWEYRWNFYDPKLLAFDLLIREYFFLGVTPNYFWANGSKAVDITMLPNANDPEEAIFRTTDIPPFEDEPYTLPDEALRTNLQLYYTNNMSPNDYWSHLSDRLGGAYERFLDEGDDVRPLVDSIAALPAGTDRAAAAFDWVRKNIRLVRSGENENKFRENESVNDVYGRRYGTEEDITLLFHRIVRDLPGYRSLLAVASDRSARVVYKNVKYWQFDGFVVRATDSSRAHTWYAPGLEGAVAGQLPWYYEGATAFVAGAEAASPLFIDLPKSEFAVNNRTNTFSVTFDEDGTAKASVRQTLTGQFARHVRALVADLPQGDQARVLEKDLSDQLSEEWRNGIADVGLEFRGDTAIISYALSGPGLSSGGGVSVVKPFSFIPESVNPLVAAERKYPIMFDHAETVIDTLMLFPGPGMVVESKPRTVYVSNSSGSYELRAEDVPDGLRIFSRAILKSAMYSASVYGQVKAIIGGKTNLRNVEVVLAPKPLGR